MTDRKPTAPGQYQMIVSADEAQKLLTGEAVTVTLVRDDQPEVAGTPYNKASVLPDELAAQVCPSVTDPTPADAFRNLLARRTNATLTVFGWAGENAPYTQTVMMDILATETPHVAAVLPNDADTADGIREAFGCISKAESRAGSILFTCLTDKPEADIPLQIEVVR